MGLFGGKRDGAVMDTIRCDENDYLIWQWHPQGVSLESSKRAYSIRWGSSLRVKMAEAAVFVYSGGEGDQQDIILGPYDKILETGNLPVLAGIVGLAYGGGTPFQAEVYFINLAHEVQTKFAVPFFDVYDPRYPDFGVPTAVRGSINFKIDDCGKFISLHRLRNFDMKEFQSQIRSAITRYVKEVVSNAPIDNNIPVFQIERRISTINDVVEEKVTKRLGRDFGVNVTSIDIDAIELDKTSQGYASLKSITQDVTSATVQAQVEANVKSIHDAQRIGSENMEDELRRKREEDQFSRHIQTESSFLTAHQIDQQAAVGIAGAQALGNMGSGSGGAGGGLDPAAMMAGMAVGGAIGQNVASVMGNMMSGLQQPVQQTPPPISSSVYHVAVNGSATGPYNIPTLMQMAASGTISGETLVWKPGMAQWAKAADVQELASIFMPPDMGAAPPPVPPSI